MSVDVAQLKRFSPEIEPHPVMIGESGSLDKIVFHNRFVGRIEHAHILFAGLHPVVSQQFLHRPFMLDQIATEKIIPQGVIPMVIRVDDVSNLSELGNLLLPGQCVSDS